MSGFLRVPGIFVVGTDTSVGKTTVATGLCRWLRRNGRAPVPFKPVETGCLPDPLDARRLWRASGTSVPLTEVCPFPLALPAAPAAAAAAVGLTLDVADLAERARRLSLKGDCIVVEGAGGLLAPYARGQTNADLAELLRLPVLVVARAALGTINHVALTIRELERRRLPLAGLVLVRAEREAQPHENSNANWIEATAGVAPRGTIPWMAADSLANDDHLADVVGGLFPELAAIVDGHDRLSGD